MPEGIGMAFGRTAPPLGHSLTAPILRKESYLSEILTVEKMRSIPQESANLSNLKGPQSENCFGNEFYALQSDEPVHAISTVDSINTNFLRRL